MNILIVDDERTFNMNRVRDFLGIEAGFSFDYARNLDDTLRLFYDTEPDAVFLDHDLGNGENVRTFTSLIEREAHTGTLFPVRKFIIHSMNPLGRREMYDALHKFYNVEFARVEDLL